MDLSRTVWRKSSRSGSQSACVELAAVPGRVAARDSKNPDGGTLVFGRVRWAAFTSRAKSGTFDPR